MINENAKEKICLCIDSSTKVASVCAAKSADGAEIEVLNYIFINDGLTHSENLIPMINRCLSACSLTVSDVDLFACINGPGSFTGLRIGISTANALAQSMQKDIIGINTLDAMAYQHKYFDGMVVSMIDARRDNVFTSSYTTGASIVKTAQDEVKSVDELLEDIKDCKGKVLFVGDGVQKAKDRALMLFSQRAFFASGIGANVNSSAGIEMALSQYFTNDCTADKVLLPNYVKGTSAKTIKERNASK